jgi:pimeloyl-ACP methyl ester carboxylesterase
MPLLATQYHVLAPDFPAFGFTVARADYNYTFSSLTITTQAFLTALNVTEYALHLMDYGGAVGIRLAITYPASVKALISQNGNIYPQGFETAFWVPVKAYWASNSTADRDALAGALSLASIQEQYLSGVPDPEKVAPETYWLDTALAARPGIGDIQLDLLFNVQFNLQELPLAQAYFHKYEPPLLVAWARTILFSTFQALWLLRLPYPDGNPLFSWRSFRGRV